MIGALAVVTMTVGNLVALRQTGAVRLLAWSTVAQAGWVILPLAGAGFDGRASGAAAGAAIAYLAAYVVASLLAFAVVAVVSRSALGGEAHELSAYAGLARRRPVLGAALAFALVALAGLPPGVMGLVAKVLALRPVVADGFWLVAAVAVVNVALGIAVYLRWGVLLLSGVGEPGAGTEPAARAGRRPPGEPPGPSWSRSSRRGSRPCCSRWRRSWSPYSSPVCESLVCEYLVCELAVKPALGAPAGNERPLLPRYPSRSR